MSKILGLDLGTNSIGWAVIDEKNPKILGSGVRIFPEGVNNKGQGIREQSKNATRREFRQARRQNYRRRLRKIKLLETLIEYKMTPLQNDSLNRWKHWDKSKKSEGRISPFESDILNTKGNEEIKEWIKLKPYELRHKALTKDITRYELGRILYHLAQRRGFKSGRKNKDTGAIYKGKDGMTGINETKEDMQGYETLGDYLYSILPKENTSYKQLKDGENNFLRVRGRYTLRQWYINEFNVIWERQAKQLGLTNKKVKVKRIFVIGNPKTKRNVKKIDSLKSKGVEYKVEVDKEDISKTKLITYKTVSLKEYFGNSDIGILFYQRPLRSQKGLLSKCRYESRKIFDKKTNSWRTIGKSVCSVSHPDFELRRAYEFINNIEYGRAQKLNDTQREIVLELINSKDKSFNFIEIKKKLKLEYEKFNYPDSFKVAVNYTICKVKPLFNKDVWAQNYHDIWHCFYDYKDSDMLVAKLAKDYGLKDNDVKKIDKIILKDGYSSLSLKAIKNILPFLKMGYQYNNAVIFGGVRNAFGSQWKTFDDNKIQEIIAHIEYLARNKNKLGELIDNIRGFLRDDYRLSENQLNKLYHHSQDIETKDTEYTLSSPKSIRNPIVQQVLYEVRNVVNAIIKKYLSKGEHFKQIKVELARDLKQSKIRRGEQTKINKERQVENDKAREVLDKFGLAHSRDNIHKWLLFKELEENNGNAICPYTGKAISIHDLFGDENKFQIEHIIPYSVCLDDSLGNKTLCESKENGKKGSQTPYQFYKKNPDKWKEVRDRAFKVLPYNKAKKFTSDKEYRTDYFIERQLNDTRYISKEAKNYLTQICNDIITTPGGVTADLRHNWGLNDILSPSIEITKNIPDGRYWIVFDDDKRVIDYYPVKNIKPSRKEGEIILTGYIKNKVFISDNISKPIIIKSNDYTDARYWLKVELREESYSLYPIFNIKPKDTQDIIVIKGEVKNKKFSKDKVDVFTPKESDGKYWLKIGIKKIDYIDKNNKHINIDKNQILISGFVKDGNFISGAKKYPTDKEGVNSALITVDPIHSTFVKIKKDKPILKKQQIITRGSIEDNVFYSDEDIEFAKSVKGDNPSGKYWLVNDVLDYTQKFYKQGNEQPKLNKKNLILQGGVKRLQNGKLKFYPNKNREDHRHHAIDAITIALTSRSYIQRISMLNANKQDRRRGLKEKKISFDMPWEHFYSDVKNSIDSILVSHRKNNKVLTKIKKTVIKNGMKYKSVGYSARGQLHESTFMGKYKHNGKEYYHKKVKLESLTAAQVEKIVDDKIRWKIKEICGCSKGEKLKSIPKDALVGVFLDNKNGGEAVPINKVRIREVGTNARHLHRDKNVWVEPGSNYIFIIKDNQGKKEGEIITFFEAVSKMRENKKIFDKSLPNNILISFQSNDMFLHKDEKDTINNINTWDIHKISKKLYRVAKFSFGKGGFSIVSSHHLYSGGDLDKVSFPIVLRKNHNTLHAIKVNISILGELEIIDQSC